MNRRYVKVHATAIVDRVATVRIFNPPEPTRVCLEIGEGSHVFGHFAVLRPHATIRIGARCQIGHSHLICAEGIDVADDVLMAWGITFMDNDSHALDWAHRSNDVRQAYDDYRADPSNLIRHKDWTHVASAPIRVGARSWIGFNVAVLKGVTIGENAVVAAHAVVVDDVAPYTVVAGNPARVIRTLARAS
jgi:acetyltransferase-like isoleucine patch superfamily enzyme